MLTRLCCPAVAWAIFLAGLLTHAQIAPGPRPASGQGVTPDSLTVAPATAAPGDRVTWTVAGPPGQFAIVAYSTQNAGARAGDLALALGPDLGIVGAGQINPQGLFLLVLSVPPGLPQRTYYFQAARTTSLETLRDLSLTNGATLVVGSTAGPGGVSYIDTHAHPHPQVEVPGSADFNGVVEPALANMNRLGIQKSLIMPPPGDRTIFDSTQLAPIVRNNPDRFAFLAGGGSLNPMIQEAVRSGTLSSDLRRRFEDRATEIVRDGAVGFGELAAEHLSFAGFPGTFVPGHPYEAAPPDHPLLLLLADIAARHDVAIDLHMEAVAADMPVPERFNFAPNPRTLRENVTGFERLLSHNRSARIVWAHAGWDNTGHKTVGLMRRLLETHSNLYLQIAIEPSLFPQNSPLDRNGRVRPEWVDLIRSFPHRFVLGSDQFYAFPGRTSTLPLPPTFDGPRAFLNQLPFDLVRRVAFENAERIYRLR